MSELTKSYIKNTFAQLGELMLSNNAELLALIETELRHNAWFTRENVSRAVKSIGKMLNREELDFWLNQYENGNKLKKIGLILAGNIPLVGFHDVLCVLASGNIALIKTSSQDSRLITWLLQQLVNIAPEFKNRYQFVERLSDFDGVIATGSNNTSRYFEYYFGRVAHIIRKNRNSIAVLQGNESPAELSLLGHDIFDYFGLGCRNVSKIYVPEDYDFSLFFEGIEPFQPIINHHKYNNNYDYNKSIYLVNQDKHLDNGFLLLKEDQKLSSPLAVLYYEKYPSIPQLEQELKNQQEQIQCVVSTIKLNISGQLVSFGQSQNPRLWDYADGIDTMNFLAEL